MDNLKKQPPKVGNDTIESYLALAIFECERLQRLILGSRMTDWRLYEIKSAILHAWELVPDEKD